MIEVGGHGSLPMIGDTIAFGAGQGIQGARQDEEQGCLGDSS